MTARIHPTAVVAPGAVIGDRTQIWLHCQIREDVPIGAWAMIGAGSVGTRSVPAYALVHGNPARQHGWVTPGGERATFGADGRFVDSAGFALRLIRDAAGERVEPA